MPQGHTLLDMADDVAALIEDQFGLWTWWSANRSEG